MSDIAAILRERYPRLIPDAFGFECEAGWLQILDDFFAFVDRTLPAGSKFELRQVKEKLGGLRVYYRLDADLPEEIRKAIDEAYDRACARSYRICEICGNRGRFSQRGGLLTVVCEEHRENEFGVAIPKEPESDYIRRTKEGWFHYDYDAGIFVRADPPEGWE